MDESDGSPLLVIAGLTGLIKVINLRLRRIAKVLSGHGNSVNDVKVHAKYPSLMLSASKVRPSWRHLRPPLSRALSVYRVRECGGAPSTTRQAVALARSNLAACPKLSSRKWVLTERGATTLSSLDHAHHGLGNLRRTSR